jgi:hypothetical protein
MEKTTRKLKTKREKDRQVQNTFALKMKQNVKGK